MPVDSSIQYNGYNSYRFVQDELLASFLFGVQDMAHVTASFQAFCTSAQTAAVRAYLRFWDINNATIQTQNISFALASAIWEKKIYTASVPTGAVKAQLFFTNPTSVAWYMAQPKVEEGEVATAYAQNLAGQMTYITPGGVYTGTVRAEQIIITSSESLEDRFVAINQNQILLAQGLDTVDAKTTKITAGGVYTGEINADQIVAGFISVDRFESRSITGAKIAAGTITGTNIAANTITADKINVTNLYVDTVRGLSDSGKYAKFFAEGSEDSSLTFYGAMTGGSPQARGRIKLYGRTSFGVEGIVKTGTDINATGTEVVTIRHGNAGIMLWNGVSATLTLGDRTLGIDTAGFYKEVAGVRTAI